MGHGSKSDGYQWNGHAVRGTVISHRPDCQQCPEETESLSDPRGFPILGSPFGFSRIPFFRSSAVSFHLKNGGIVGCQSVPRFITTVSLKACTILLTGARPRLVAVVVKIPYLQIDSTGPLDLEITTRIGYEELRPKQQIVPTHSNGNLPRITDSHKRLEGDPGNGFAIGVDNPTIIMNWNIARDVFQPQSCQGR